MAQLNRPRTLLAVLFLCGLNSCALKREDPSKRDLGVAPAPSPLADSAAYRDTIGALTYVNGLSPLRIRGYGLVVGLGNNGSRECPRAVRDQLIQSLSKQYRFSSGVVGDKSMSPERLVDGIDTAPVIVQGEVPGAAVVGDPFDVVVTALPGTQTKSLVGGWLFPTELAVYRVSVGGAGTVTGKPLASAAGPVFINPFSGEGAATRSTPLEGIVLGGAQVSRERDITLFLITPSYGVARRIEERINTRFPDPRKVADAVSAGMIKLRVPPEFSGDSGHFVELVQSVYMSHDPAFEDARARALGEEIVRPTAPHAQIALCFEALGRASISVLNELYAHAAPYASFHAGVAGIRLGEHLGADAVALHAADPKSEYRFAAIRALGGAKGLSNAAQALRRLLNDEDPRVAIAAYEALVDRRDAAVRTTQLENAGFRVDQIERRRDNLIYVRRSRGQRVALFGQELRCRPPLHYASPDQRLTINAFDNDRSLTVLRTESSVGAHSGAIAAPTDLPELIFLLGSQPQVESDGTVAGLGLGYGDVTRALYELCADGTINAKFHLEQPNAAELFGPPQPSGRPESEL